LRRSVEQSPELEGLEEEDDGDIADGFATSRSFVDDDILGSDDNEESSSDKSSISKNESNEDEGHGYGNENAEDDYIEHHAELWEDGGESSDEDYDSSLCDHQDGDGRE
jgi:hypothetical protein